MFYWQLIAAILFLLANSQIFDDLMTRPWWSKIRLDWSRSSCWDHKISLGLRSCAWQPFPYTGKFLVFKTGIIHLCTPITSKYIRITSWIIYYHLDIWRYIILYDTGIKLSYIYIHDILVCINRCFLDSIAIFLGVSSSSMTDGSAIFQLRGDDDRYGTNLYKLFRYI